MNNLSKRLFMMELRINTTMCVFLILVAFVYLSCSSTNNAIPTKVHSLVLDVDSPMVESVMDDSLLSIINNADSLSIYELCYPQLVHDTIGNIIATDTISSYVMSWNNVAITPEMITVLKFIMGDKNVYQADYPAAKQPFSPYVAVKFIAAKGVVYLLYSFSTNQLAFTTKDDVLLTCKIKDWYSLERWMHQILPNNEYISSKIYER